MRQPQNLSRDEEISKDDDDDDDDLKVIMIILTHKTYKLLIPRAKA